jgi:hypothetical protein
MGLWRKWPSLNDMSGLPSEEDIICEICDVRKVPISEVKCHKQAYAGGDGTAVRLCQPPGPSFMM